MPIENTEATFKLQDRTAVITGPCNTVNQAIAMKLTMMGVNIVLLDANTERTSRFANQLMDSREVYERYGRAVALQADLTKTNQIQDAIGRAAECFGGIDIFIDGLMKLGARSFKEPSTLEDFDAALGSAIDTNLRAPLLTSHAIMKYLSGRKRGRVIYLMHDLPRQGFAGAGLLAATRTGLTSFARTLAREVADLNITVNCVATGISEEFLMTQLPISHGSIQEALMHLQKSLPHALMTEPEKIANLVAFLASPLASAITGQTMAVNQGLSFN